MGYLTIRDTGSNQVNVEDDSSFTYTSNLGASNPTAGVRSLKPFDFSYDSGAEPDVSPVLTGEIPRITAGTSNAIPISLSCKYNRTVIELFRNFA